MTETPRQHPITVLGAGSWGTALAIQLARAAQPTVLWGRAEDQPELLAVERCNQRYLPDARFPDDLTIEPLLEKALRGTDDVLVCVPSVAFRQVLIEIKPYMTESSRIAWATKGFEQQTGKLPHQVAREVLGDKLPLAVLSGPTFAREVGAGLPTAMTIAATDADFGHSLAERISNQQFRAYTSDDIIGVEVGGAVKNVIAIAAGISDGLGYGANTRIALISRGLIEMTRLGVALGAKASTFTGLSGMGDLTLTCTDDQSRNRRMGLALASGRSADEIAREIGQVVEGVYAANAVYEVAARENIEMPICEQVYLILYAGATPADAVTALMSRALTSEA
ncbi:MAG: NAD(P)-dependent glycerol-3-phosphate dehydrogenase [Gammaproteobacteria bacterium]|nr:NAD(P)-dependent glycerol-3-phosphate dehydrogenase [Gammaproteobacteria bacterium]